MKPPDVSPQQLEAMLKRLHLACARRNLLRARSSLGRARRLVLPATSSPLLSRRPRSSIAAQTRLRRCRSARPASPSCTPWRNSTSPYQPELQPPAARARPVAPEFAAQGG